MKAKSPVKLEELLKVQGIGPKKILKLYKELKVTDIESLKKAAESNEISKLEGFGDKSQGNILESIEFAITNKDRKSIALVEPEIQGIIEYLKRCSEIAKFEVVGSYRRRKETVADIDILVASSRPEDAMSYFVNFPKTEKILGHGDTKSSIWLDSKIQVDIRIIPLESFGSALQYFTGSVEHNVKLRNIAISKGYKLSEYGLFNRKTNKVVESKSEKKIYEILVSNYVEPELREDKGELDSAIKNSLPHLITLDDIKGDIQMHSTFSDGVNSIEEMAQKGIELGYKYIGISDHFGKLKIAGAIDESEFDEYLEAVREADSKVKAIKILAGGEVEIDADGNLEFAEEKLKKLDFVVAAIHFKTGMESDLMTKRIIKAVQNPLTTFLAHPTNRLIGQRPGYEFDYNQVFKEAKENNVALEINSQPLRLDLNDSHVKAASEMGCKIVINTDAHSVHEMEYMKYGLDVARRGWIEKKGLFYPNT